MKSGVVIGIILTVPQNISNRKETIIKILVDNDYVVKLIKVGIYNSSRYKDFLF